MPSAVFFGSPSAAVPSLRAVADAIELRAVVTRPARRRGRGRSMLPTAVAEEAARLDIPVHTPTTREELGGLPLDVDIAVVVAFGMLIQEEVLTRPRRGFLNVHFSLLPRWRGAAPVERAILAGDPETGVCLMAMDVGLDTGPVYACERRAVGTHTGGELTDLLAEDGARLLTVHLGAIVDGRLRATPQEGPPTHAPKLRREEGLLDLALPTEHLLRRIRAFTPRPGAAILTEEGPLKVWAADASGAQLPPGRWFHEGDRVLIGTSDGALRLREVQAAGSRRLPAGAWAHGRRGQFPSPT